MSSTYPELDKLRDLWDAHDITIDIDFSDHLGERSDYPKVNFKLNGKSYSLYVDDEFEDFKKDNPVLDLCLVLRELEGYFVQPDHELWCKERFVRPEDEQIKAAFDLLRSVALSVQDQLGKIDSHISDWDFQMNAGAAQELRK